MAEYNLPDRYYIVRGTKMGEDVEMLMSPFPVVDPHGKNRGARVVCAWPRGKGNPRLVSDVAWADNAAMTGDERLGEDLGPSFRKANLVLIGELLHLTSPLPWRTYAERGYAVPEVTE